MYSKNLYESGLIKEGTLQQQQQQQQDEGGDSNKEIEK
jgi:hypothetical protein